MREIKQKSPQQNMAHGRQRLARRLLCPGQELSCEDDLFATEEKNVKEFCEYVITVLAAGKHM